MSHKEPLIANVMIETVHLQRHLDPWMEPISQMDKTSWFTWDFQRIDTRYVQTQHWFVFVSHPCLTHVFEDALEFAWAFFLWTFARIWLSRFLWWQNHSLIAWHEIRARSCQEVDTGTGKGFVYNFWLHTSTGGHLLISRLGFLKKRGPIWSSLRR